MPGPHHRNVAALVQRQILLSHSDGDPRYAGITQSGLRHDRLRFEQATDQGGKAFASPSKPRTIPSRRPRIEESRSGVPTAPDEAASRCSRVSPGSNLAAAPSFQPLSATQVVEREARPERLLGAARLAPRSRSGPHAGDCVRSTWLEDSPGCRTPAPPAAAGG